jgi:hypothetical protein
MNAPTLLLLRWEELALLDRVQNHTVRIHRLPDDMRKGPVVLVRASSRPSHPLSPFAVLKPSFPVAWPRLALR